MPYFSPAPGRVEGRVYYYAPPTIDFAKPSALLVYLHGGTSTTAENAPDVNYLSGPDGACPFRAVRMRRLLRDGETGRLAAPGCGASDGDCPRIGAVVERVKCSQFFK